ncbi:MAG: tetratricopeptide repeat protein, partial [Gammaproteobacteria bacterium]|nr:tetratricopeptide repeat protein [Gammaproteobacteria bacterium]
RVFKQDQEALKALINKSNTYAKNQQRQKRVIVGGMSAIAILFFGGFYLYQVITTSDSIYIEQPGISQTGKIVQPVEKISKKAESQQLVENKEIVNIENDKSDELIKQPVRQPVKKIVPAKKQKIIIVRKKTENPTDELLSRAYNAFIDGDYASSKNLYQQVVINEPKNRDGILGLAAIAIKEQRYESASQKYKQLLYMDPKDSVARAGISSLESKIDPALNESKLKFMLREQPEAAHLYFALGSLYVPQKRWADAQSAFFSAWSAENTNPDYAFNLAVSLDNLNKKKEAKKFYQLSLSLSPASGGNFSKADVIARIKNIEDQHE